MSRPASRPPRLALAQGAPESPHEIELDRVGIVGERGEVVPRAGPAGRLVRSVKRSPSR